MIHILMASLAGFVVGCCAMAKWREEQLKTAACYKRWAIPKVKSLRRHLHLANAANRRKRSMLKNLRHRFEVDRDRAKSRAGRTQQPTTLDQHNAEGWY